MANSEAIIREVRCLVRGRDGQGVIDVYVFAECPDFPPAHGWRHGQCPNDEPLIEWLGSNIGHHLDWPIGAPENK